LALLYVEMTTPLAWLCSAPEAPVTPSVVARPPAASNVAAIRAVAFPCDFKQFVVRVISSVSS
jgi:fermentation-respiration switch protein FrsA (DUF1100 family)